MSSKRSLISRFANNKWELTIFAVVFIYLYSVLNSCLLFDDLLNSLIHGAKINNGKISYAINEATCWYQWGRFSPLGLFLRYPLFDAIAYTANSRVEYKLFLIIMILNNVWLFSVVIERITSSKRLKLIAMFYKLLITIELNDASQEDMPDKEYHIFNLDVDGCIDINSISVEELAN